MPTRTAVTIEQDQTITGQKTIQRIINTTPHDLAENVVWIDKYSDLETAIDTISSTVTTLIVHKADTLTTNKTIPSTLHIILLGQGVVTINSGVTLTNNGTLEVLTPDTAFAGSGNLTINGPFQAPIRQVFGSSLTVTFGADAVNYVYPQWWGAAFDGSTDDSTPWQSCITAAAGRVIRFLSGTSRIDTGLTYSTSGNTQGLQILGDGPLLSIFDNRVASGILLFVDGSGTALQFQRNGRLSGFQIQTTTSPASSIGLQLQSVHDFTLEDLFITGLSSDAIKIVNDNGDSDSSIRLKLEHIRLNSNGGWGLHMPDPATTTNACGYFVFDNVEVSTNTSGGYRVGGIGHRWQGGYINNNSVVGLQAPRTYSTTATGWKIEQVEFQDNSNYHIDFHAAQSGELTCNRFIYDTDPATGIRLGDGTGTVEGVFAHNNFHRRDAGTITWYEIGTGSNFNRIYDEDTNTTTGTTKYSDSGTATEIRELGEYRLTRQAVTSTSTSGSYTPDIQNGMYHRILVNATGAFTVNAPTNPEEGRELILEIFNTSGGAITVSFNAIFTTNNYTDPAASMFRTARFFYEPNGVKWKQIGDWSGDM